MTNPPEERISALMDGELDANEQRAAVDDLLTQGDKTETWRRYHFISDTLKGNLPAGIEQGFSDRVMAALGNEPTVLSPQKRPSWGQRAAGLAVAASVAAVAVLGVQFMYQQDTQAPAPQVAQHVPPSQNTTLMAKKNAERVGVQPNIQTVTQSASQSVHSADTTAKIVKHFHPRLNKYLVDHNQQAARAMHGIAPYARIMAYPNSHRILIQAQK